MSSALSQLKARQLAASASSNKIETGVASSAAPPTATTPAVDPPVAASADPVADLLMAELKKKYPDGGYLMKKVKRIILRNGAVVAPDDYGVIATKDEEALKELEYFAAQGPHMVEKI